MTDQVSHTPHFLLHCWANQNQCKSFAKHNTACCIQFQCVFSSFFMNKIYLNVTNYHSKYAREKIYRPPGLGWIIMSACQKTCSALHPVRNK